MVNALTSLIKAQARVDTQNKGKGKGPIRKAKTALISQSELSASETPNEEGYGDAWESDDWSSSHWPDDSSTSAAGVVLHESSYCMDGINPFLNLANHPTHVGSGPWLQHSPLDQERQLKDSRSMHRIMALQRKVPAQLMWNCTLATAQPQSRW